MNFDNDSLLNDLGWEIPGIVGIGLGYGRDNFHLALLIDWP